MVALKGIPKVLSPELLFALARMGHGDEIGEHVQSRQRGRLAGVRSTVEPLTDRVQERLGTLPQSSCPSEQEVIQLLQERAELRPAIGPGHRTLKRANQVPSSAAE